MNKNDKSTVKTRINYNRLNYIFGLANYYLFRFTEENGAIFLLAKVIPETWDLDSLDAVSNFAEGELDNMFFTVFEECVSPVKITIKKPKEVIMSDDHYRYLEH